MVVSETHIEFRMIFPEPDQVSLSKTTDTVHVTLNISVLKTSEGEYIPDGSQLSRELPLQVDNESAESIELIGTVTSWVMLTILAINGITNTLFDELDYSSLLDGIEGS